MIKPFEFVQAVLYAMRPFLALWTAQPSREEWYIRVFYSCLVFERGNPRRKESYVCPGTTIAECTAAPDPVIVNRWTQTPFLQPRYLAPEKKRRACKRQATPRQTQMLCAQLHPPLAGEGHFEIYKAVAKGNKRCMPKHGESRKKRRHANTSTISVGHHFLSDSLRSLTHPSQQAAYRHRQAPRSCPQQQQGSHERDPH